jgi:hypothetical protein
LGRSPRDSLLAKRGEPQALAIIDHFGSLSLPAVSASQEIEDEV